MSTHLNRLRIRIKEEMDKLDKLEARIEAANKTLSYLRIALSRFARKELERV
jgi:predicted  nucleic acid-binding Zn-ribbon protein